MKRLAIAVAMTMVVPAAGRAGSQLEVTGEHGAARVVGRDRAATPAASAVAVAVGWRLPHPAWSVRLRARHLWFRIAPGVEQSHSGVTVELERALGDGVAVAAGFGAALFGGPTLAHKIGAGPAVAVRLTYAVLARLHLTAELSGLELASGRVMGGTAGIAIRWPR